jgi:hypothetical protein
MKPPEEIILLKIRNLIADKEMEVAIANKEMDLGNWLCDHALIVRELDNEIQQLFKELETT